MEVLIKHNGDIHELAMTSVKGCCETCSLKEGCTGHEDTLQDKLCGCQDKVGENYHWKVKK